MSLFIRKLSTGFMAIGAVLLLSGCTGWNVDAAKQAQPCGSAFTQALHKEYLAFVDAKVKLENWQSADYFARKALAAACGQVVLPEDPAAWDIPAKDMNELVAARAKLLALLNSNARTVVPCLAATAQVKYDCWVEGKNQICHPCHTLADRYPKRTEACRCDFYKLIAKIEKAMTPKVVIKPKKRVRYVPLEIIDQK